MKLTDADIKKYFGVDVTPQQVEYLKLQAELYPQKYETLKAQAIELGLSQDGKVTEEQFQELERDLEEQRGVGTPQGYREQPVRAAPPMETGISSQQSAYNPLERVQTTGGQRLIKEYAYDVRVPLETMLRTELNKSNLQQQDIDNQVDSILYTYDQIARRYKDKSPEEHLQILQEALTGMESVGTIKDQLETLQVDKEGSQRQFINAFKQQIELGEIPAYSPEQIDLLGYNQKKLLDRYYETAKRQVYNQDYDVVLLAGYLVPLQVAEYLGNNVGGVVYNNARDKEIRKAYLDSVSKTPFGDRLPIAKTVTLSFDKRTDRSVEQAADALAKVQAYQQIGNYDWTLDPERRDFVLSNLDSYKTDNWFFDNRTALGGTAETDASYMARLAFAPMNALTAVGYGVGEVGVSAALQAGMEGAEAAGLLPEADYFDPTALYRARQKERKENAPLYEDGTIFSSVYDNIARNKGVAGEVEGLAKALNIDELDDQRYYWAMMGGGVIGDFLNPDLDIMVGAAKAPSKFVKVAQAHNKIHDAGSLSEGFKAAQQMFTSNVLDDWNLIGATTKLVSPKTQKALTNLEAGDVRLYMGQNVARNLEAERIANASQDPLQALQDANLLTTEYGRILQSDGFDAANRNMRKLKSHPDATELYAEYRVTQQVVDDMRTMGVEAAINKAKKEGVVVDGRQTDIKPNFDRLQDVIDHPYTSSVDDIARGLDTLYGRSMLFEVTPNIGSLDDLIAVTPNTWATRKGRAKIIAAAAQSDVGKLLHKISFEPLERVVDRGRRVEAPLFGEDVIQESIETSIYRLNNLPESDIQNLLKVVERSNIDATAKANIQSDILGGYLLKSDHIRLNNNNIERLAKLDFTAATLEDINRLPPAEQKILSEGFGTAERAFESLKSYIAQLPEVFNRTNIKLTKEQLIEPTVRNRLSYSAQEQRILDSIDREVGQLELFARRELDALMAKGYSPQEAMSRMIVGLGQDDVGIVAQQQRIYTVMDFLFDQVFYTVKGQRVSSVAPADLLTGLNFIYVNDIYSGFGLKYKEHLLNTITEQSISNPSRFWDYLQSGYEEMDRALRSSKFTYEVVDDVGEVTEVTGKVRATHVPADAIQRFDPKDMNNIVLSSYMAGEVDKITKRAIVQTFEKDFEAFTVGNLFPNIDIDQDLYNRVLKYSTGDLYNSRMPYIDQVRTIEDIIDTEGRMHNVRTAQYSDNFDSNNLMGEINKVLKSSRKDVLNSVQEQLKRIKINGKPLTSRQKQQFFNQAKDTLDGWYNSLEGKGPIEILNELEQTPIPFLSKGRVQSRKGQMTFLDLNEDLRKALEAHRKEPFTPDEANEMAQKVFDQKRLIQRNNGLLNDDSISGPEFIDELDKLFGEGNQDAARAILGNDVYENLHKEIYKRGYGYIQQNIQQVLRNDGMSTAAIQYILRVTSSFAYTSILTFRPAYYVVNILSAPFIMYQTVGRSGLINALARTRVRDVPNALLNAGTTLPKRAMDVVMQGRSKGSEKFDEVAVRSPTGKTYTFGEVYQMLESAGIKSEYTYITSALTDGTLLRMIEDNTTGTSKTFKDIMVEFAKNERDGFKRVVDKANYLATGSDMAFRASVFIESVEAGADASEALALARRSLFDYNDTLLNQLPFARSAFIFASFFYANNMNLLKAYTDPAVLARYARLLRMTNTTNTLNRALNDDHEMPYNMYFPSYAQFRIRYNYQVANDQRAYFKMAPSLPAMEAMQFHFGVIGMAMTWEGFSVEQAIEPIMNMRSPIVKILVQIASEQGDEKQPDRVRQSYVQFFNLLTDGDPVSIAQAIEFYCGGQVKPKFVGYEAVGNVDGYHYPLDDKQKKVFNSTWDVFWNMGMSAMYNSYGRLLFPEGTTMQGATSSERAAQFLGFATRSRMYTPEAQEMKIIQAHLTAMRKIENRAKQSAKDSIIVPKNPRKD